MRPALVALAAAALLLTATPAADAGTWRGHDPGGDVRSYSFDFDQKCQKVPAGKPEPSDQRRDITRLEVDHGADDVVLGLDLGDVAPHDQQTSYEFYVHTPGRTFDVEVTPKRSGAVGVVIEPVRVRQDSQCGPTLTTGNDLTCDGAVADVDAATDHVALTLPRTCLGDPRWVRVGAVAVGFDGHLGPNSSTITLIADVWSPNGAGVGNLFPPSGPKVKVG